jgi:hypothetical protein
MDEKSNLNEKDVSFKHPFDQERIIVVIICICHLAKAIRNALLAIARLLWNNTGIITYDVIRNIRKRDQIIEEAGGAPETRLDNDVADMDTFSKMRMTYCKVVSEEKTLNAGICSLISHHGIQVDQRFMGTSIRSKIDILKNCIWIRKHGEHDYDAVDPLPTLEYLNIMNELFNSLFLNMSLSIDSTNIDQMELKVNYILQSYFFSWYQKSKRDKTPKSFLAGITYANLRRSMAGIFSFSRAALKLGSQFYDKYI